MNLLNKFQTLYNLLLEEIRLAKPQCNNALFSKISERFEEEIDDEMPIKKFLKINRPFSIPKVRDDWVYNEVKNEWWLDYSSTLFSDGRIRLSIPPNARKIIVKLPGTLTSAADVMEASKSVFYLRSQCESANCGLAVWDWPLQGVRLRNSVYTNFRYFASAEKQYSRFLPSLGTSLWREYISELHFCLENIQKKIGTDVKLEVFGWSQGAWFSYFAPFCSANIKKIVAAGSCADIGELIRSGRPHVHGYFFYPHMMSGRFSLHSVVGELMEANIQLSILFGDSDRGCQQTTAELLMNSYGNRNLNVKILPGLRHKYSGTIQEMISLEIES